MQLTHLNFLEYFSACRRNWWHWWWVTMTFALSILVSTWPPFQMNPDKTISAFPEGDNLFRWKGTIHGASSTVRKQRSNKTHLWSYLPPGLWKPRIQTIVWVPRQLPVRSTHSEIWNPHLSSERRSTRKYLPRHLKRKVVSIIWRSHSAFVNSESPRRYHCDAKNETIYFMYHIFRAKQRQPVKCTSGRDVG